MWSGASQLDAIFHCRRRDGVADAARNAMKQSEANKVAANPHGKGDAARNECDARQFSPEKTAALLRFADLPGQQPAEVDLGVTTADAFGDPGFERDLAGLDPVEKFAVGKPDFTGELPDRKPRGAQHEAQTLFVAAKVIGAGTAGMGERIHDTAFFTARPKNERELLLHYPTWRLW